MTLTIELRRVGMSRVSERGIPLVARVFSNGRFGENLIGHHFTDIECAKEAIRHQMDQKYGFAVGAIEWIDRTAEPNAPDGLAEPKL